MQLSAEVVAEIRELLAERRRDAARRLAALGRQVGEIVDATYGANVDDEHDPEGATIAFERGQVDALAQSAARDLTEIDAAVQRLADGTYGTCERCGRPVPVDRLRVRPTARTCVGCASAR